MRAARAVSIVCLLVLTGNGFCDEPNDSGPLSRTGTYAFVTDKSTVVQTGGIAGVNEVYAIRGSFQVTLDFATGAASFDRVDAVLVGESPFLPTRSLNELFNMTSLSGTLLSDTLIEFVGETASGTGEIVLLCLSLAGEQAILTGGTIPPPNSADFFVFTLDAAARLKGPDEPCGPTPSGEYVFLQDRSTVVQTGGIAGIRRVYCIRGSFRLSVDPNVGTASFAGVDARLVDPNAVVPDRSLDEIFNLTALASTVVDEASIRFQGKAPDGSEVLITLTCTDGEAHLVGETVPPPNSADFFIFTIDAAARRKYAGGTGTPNDPYMIMTTSDLVAIDSETDTLGKYFLLMNNLDLDPNLAGGRAFGHAVIDAFSGDFDGGGHSIENLVIDDSEAERLGLFGAVCRQGRIHRLKLNNGLVKGGPQRTGLLAGIGDGTIEDCRVGGCVVGRGAVGGLIGDALGTIRRCSAEVVVVGRDGSYYVGGLIGWNGGLLVDCHARGEIIGQGRSADLGGLVGAMGYSGDVRIVGSSYVITRCSADVRVSGGDDARRVGGLIGHCAEGVITDSYATGDVIGGERCSYLGGLAGRNGAVGEFQNIHTGIIRNCYAAGSVTSGPESQGLGGLVGWNEVGDVHHSFWDVVTTHQTASDGGTGLTTAEMQVAHTYLEAGWDFVDETANGVEDIWWIEEGRDYPRLWWERMPADDLEDGETASP